MLRYIVSTFLFALVSAGTNQEGLDFLAKKKQEEGVIETASGLLYKVRMFCWIVTLDDNTNDAETLTYSFAINSSISGNQTRYWWVAATRHALQMPLRRSID